MEKVTKERAMEMLNILPPRIWYKNTEKEEFQVGEVTDHNEKGQAVYDTYARNLKEDQWYYLGTLPTPNVPKDQILMSENW